MRRKGRESIQLEVLMQQQSLSEKSSNSSLDRSYQASFILDGSGSSLSGKQRQERRDERRKRKFLREARKHRSASKAEKFSKSMSIFKMSDGPDDAITDDRKREKKLRQETVDEELNTIIAEAVAKELSKPISPEAYKSLQLAAMKLCYVKKFYDALRDQNVYFPTVHATIVDHSLTKTAQTIYTNRTNQEFPIEYDAAMRSVALQASLDDHNHNDHGDDMVFMEYAERLAVDIDFLSDSDGDSSDDFGVSDSKIAYGELDMKESIQAAIHAAYDKPPPTPPRSASQDTRSSFLGGGSYHDSHDFQSILKRASGTVKRHSTGGASFSSL